MSLPSPDSPDAPKYWRAETSGVLEGPIMRYLEGKALSAGDLALIRIYLKQWIDSPAWLMNPHESGANRQAIIKLRQQVRLISRVEDLSAWLHAALELGIDPL
jgi:hypothetical protein